MTATLLVVKNEYPVSASMNDQKQLLSRISKQRAKPFDQELEEELMVIQETCALADIDFEFVLDSSGSIGSPNWEKTTDLIAKYWIEDAIRPSGSPQCGNHVAIRRYSYTHHFDLDFTPTNYWISNGFSNYTEESFQINVIFCIQYSFFLHHFFDGAENPIKYVANVFQNLQWLASGTDTAGALEKVRIQDIIKTRGDTTYVMVFTDGASNSKQNTVNQAKLLKPLVDEVYAFGIGQGRDEQIMKFNMYENPTHSNDPI